jgi:hypothetical protein
MTSPEDYVRSRCIRNGVCPQCGQPLGQTWLKLVNDNPFAVLTALALLLLFLGFWIWRVA